MYGRAETFARTVTRRPRRRVETAVAPPCSSDPGAVPEVEFSRVGPMTTLRLAVS